LIDDQQFAVEITLESRLDGGFSATVYMPGLAAGPLNLDTAWQPGLHIFEASLGKEEFSLSVEDRTQGYWLRHRGFAALVRVYSPRIAELAARLPERPEPDTSKLIVSPMPGLIVTVNVEPGQDVKAGETLLTVEAMKMENVLRAERDGTVKSVGVKAGDSVAADELLVELE